MPLISVGTYASNRHCPERYPGIYCFWPIKFSLLWVLLLLHISVFANEFLDSLEFKHGIAFYHDLKYPSDFKHFDYVNPEAPKGGKWVVPTQANFNSLSPSGQFGIVAPDAYWITHDRLLERSGDESSAFYGRLANGIALTADRKTVIFRIHPSARWHDGVPITSRDVAFSIEFRKADIEGQMFYSFIDRLEEINDRHIAMHLRKPITSGDIITLQWTPILPSHYWSKHDPTAVTMKVPIGSGPYRIGHVQQSRFIEYERVENYWARDLPTVRGRYNFDVIRYEVYRDATVVREALRKGLIDAWTEPDFRYWHSAYDIPALQKGWLKKIHRNNGMEIGIQHIVTFNLRRAKFTDRRVRRALALAMDFEWWNKTLQFDYGTRAHSYWPDTELAAVGLPSEDEIALVDEHRDLIPPEFFTEVFRFVEVTTEGQHRHNMVKARELLNEAGFTIQNGILRGQDGQKFEIEFISQNSEDKRLLLPYFKNLQQLGIHSRVRLMDSSQYVNRLREFDYDAMVRDSTFIAPPVLELKSFFHTESAVDPLSRNPGGISHPVVDMLVEKAITASSMRDVVAACRALDRLLLWEYFQLPLDAVARPKTVYWDKFGRPDVEPKIWPPFPDGWWYDPDKAARIGILN